jgi:formamidopyrimidine-DNA glycosylase
MVSCPNSLRSRVTRRGIAAPLLGAQVQAARLGKPLRWPLGCDVAQLAGRTVGAITRRGKYLWLPLPLRPLPAAPTAMQGPGAEAGGLLLHLGMSGSLGLLDAPPPPGPHDHFDLVTDCGTLRLNDPRRFGAVVWSRGAGRRTRRQLLRRLGAEPFDPALTPEASTPRCKRAAVRPSRPCCWRATWWSGPATSTPARRCLKPASIPHLRADRISRPRATALLAALRHTLARALAWAAARCATSRRAWHERRLSVGGGGVRPRRAGLRPLRQARAAGGAGAALDLLLRRLPAPLNARSDATARQVAPRAWAHATTQATVHVTAQVTTSLPMQIAVKSACSAAHAVR